MAARCNGDSCIRTTCNNAIVRTAGNNWTIYEPRGLALRMYDYGGKRCVAHSVNQPVTHHLTPPHRYPFPPSPHLLTACNYSRPLYLHPMTDCENRTGNLTEEQYRRGQRSFCALSSHFATDSCVNVHGGIYIKHHAIDASYFYI